MSLILNLFRPLGTGPNFPTDWETVPKLLPTSAEDLYTSDFHLVMIHLINGTSGPVTVTINDKQSSPLPVIPTAISIAANTDMIWVFAEGGRLCPGGISWVASSANAITGYVRGR